MIQQQAIKPICDLVANTICWASVAALLSGIQSVVVILSAAASLIWIGIQVYEWNKKRKIK